MVSSDELFASLPSATQRRIDDAFYVTSSTLSSDSSPGGEGGGGFIVNDDPPPRLNHDQIPLDLVPDTLRHLGLPAEDDEILAVFRNAATGWQSSASSSSSSSSALSAQKGGGFELGVSLDDWRAVCSVLLEGDDGGEEDGSREARGYEMDEDEEDEEAEFRGQDLSGSDSTFSDDEFVPNQVASSSKKKTQIRRSGRGSMADPVQGSQITAYQEQAALETFALFFPDVPAAELLNQKIMIKDIQHVAGLLKEKLKSEEVLDMLEMFSTTPEKSMSFANFMQMLKTINLI